MLNYIKMTIQVVVVQESQARLSWKIRFEL